jgi:pimeloyl-ACP methyl ester carboxylesterase
MAGPAQGGPGVNGTPLNGFERDGLVFDVRDGGPRDGAVVVLLHGFPQDSTSWSAVEPLLHTAGLRTLAPDQRGYSPGARPEGRAAYALREASADVVAMLDAAGVQHAHLVGHDWGGAVVWDATERHPERFLSAVPISTPHPAAFAYAFTHSLQALRSWYTALFQVPVLAEVTVAPALERALLATGLPRERARYYAERMREPGALTGGLAWYRGAAAGIARGLLQEAVPAALRAPARGTTTYRSPVPNWSEPHWSGPTTFVWGRHDPWLGRAGAERTAAFVRGDYRFVEVDGGHWLPENNPGDVAAAILARTAPDAR